VDAAIGASHPRLEVSLDTGARLQLLERHVSEGDAASFVNVATRIRIGTGAGLCHYRIQETAPKAIWLDTLEADVARDGRYELHAAALGAGSARSTALVRLAGQGAAACVYGVSIGERHQVLDTFVRVEHAAPHTRTEETFRGIAAGRSRVAFNGAVVVRANARGADSRQSLRGLLAGPEAEIDARPQLEIYTDDVRATHGATAGTLDENMLFYLLSRGIDRATARSLLEWAFLEDVVSKVGVPELRRQIEHAIAARLRSTTDLEEVA
jgi:Fe-S cluster assembly protein SufD